MAEESEFNGLAYQQIFQGLLHLLGRLLAVVVRLVLHIELQEAVRELLENHQMHALRIDQTIYR